MRIFCNHKWEVLKDTITESDFEHAVKVMRQQGVKEAILPGGYSEYRKNITICACAKCGKLERFVEYL